MNNWSTIKKGDKIYILFPKITERGIEYEYQESYIISNKDLGSNGNPYQVIRFKFTNRSNKRQRIQIYVTNINIDNKYICINLENKRINSGDMWGNMIVAIDKNILPETYRNMIKFKEMEINTLITCYQDFLVELDLMKRKNILKDE